MTEKVHSLDSLITHQMAENPDDLLTRYILVAEFVSSSSGERYLARDFEDSMETWEMNALAAQFEDHAWED